MKARYRFAKTATLPVVLVALFGFSRVSFADPVDVSFATAVATNDSALDFSVTNNPDGSNSISFFGVALPLDDMAGSASGWGYGAYDNPWTNADAGGSGTVDNNPDNNLWCCTFSGVAPGSTVSGFEVRDSADGATRTSVDWFAFAHGRVNNRDGSFSNLNSFSSLNNAASPYNSGFEGVASAGSSVIPAPFTLMLLGTGLVGLAGTIRSRTRS